MEGDKKPISGAVQNSMDHEPDIRAYLDANPPTEEEIAFIESMIRPME